MAISKSTGFSEGNINISANSSSLTINIYFSANNSTTWFASKVLYCSCNGQTQSANVRHDRGGSVSASFTFYDIGHEADGSKTVGWSWYCVTETTTLGTISDSGNFTLTTIPRASAINSFSGNNIEGSFSVNYTSYYSGFTNKLRISIPNVIALQTYDNYGSGSSVSFSQSTLNYLYQYMTSTNSVNIGAVIETWNGSTKIGESTELVNVFNITNVNPIFSTFTYKDSSSSVSNVTGNNLVLVKGLSNLQAKITSSNKMVTQKGATPTKYTFNIADKSYTFNYSENTLTMGLGTVNAVGEQRLVCRAYDSRGNSTAVTQLVTVYDYDKPEINASISRLNNWENETTLKVSGTYSTLTIGNVEKNTITSIQYRYRETGGTWSNWISLTKTVSNGSFSCSDVILSLDNTKSFEFEIQAIDNLQTNTESLTLGVGEAVFFISTNQKKCFINGQEALTYEGWLDKVAISTTEKKIGYWYDR